jgi:hypothetical protein
MGVRSIEVSGGWGSELRTCIFVTVLGDNFQRTVENYLG